MKTTKQAMAILTTAAISLCGGSAHSQPNWEVNTADFQYTMTAAGTGIFDCIPTGNPEDRVAAFIDGEVRGVAHFDTQVNGKTLAYLTIYDHSPTGSQVSFKLYEAETDQVSDVVEGLVFSEGFMAGNSAEPFRFRNQYELDQLSLSGNTLFYFTETGETVGELELVDEMGHVLPGVFSFVDDTLGPDNALFSLADNELVWEGDVFGLNRDTLTIHLRGIAETGCSLDRVWQIQVMNNSLPPTGLATDTMYVPENEHPGWHVGTLEALDETPDDVHVFTFEDGENTSDHANFEISGAELYTTRSLDFEKQAVHRLQIRITDLSGNYVVATLTVPVTDVPEAGELKAGNLVTPNGDGHNDVFYIPNLGMYPNHELLIYNAMGNRVFQTTRYDNGWTGHTDSGTALPTGTYYYIFQDSGKSENRYEGEIHLYRENKF